MIFRRATEADLPSIIALLNDDEIARSREGFAAEVTAQTREAFTEISGDPNNELWSPKTGKSSRPVSSRSSRGSLAAACVEG